MSTSRSSLWGLLLVAFLSLAWLPARDSAAEDRPPPARYIVQLAGDPLAAFAARSPGGSAQGRAGKLDAQSQPLQAQRARLAAGRRSALAAIARRIGADPPVSYVYDAAFNGLAVELTPAQARAISGLPGVVAVWPEQVYRLDSDVGPAWIGADQIWDGGQTGVYAATVLGENMSPAVSTSLSGRGVFSLGAGGALAYTLTIAGPAETVSAAAIVRATNGTTLATLSPGASAGAYAGSVSLLANDIALLQSGQLYVNVATAAQPAGALRGTIDGYQGEGVIVGVIDTGINTTHPSFAEVGGDGYRHLNPLGQGVFKGACDPGNLPATTRGNPSGYNPAIICNNKLIGAWTFKETAPIGNFSTGEPSPNDEDGHGSHTASTAAGNVLTGVSLDGVSYPRISGVAPHASIIAYDACGYQDALGYNPDCPGAALLAAVNQAVIDQVDVINYSISGGSSPWEDPIEQAFLSARAAGIVVSTSAGNSGPTAGTVAHQSPWLLAVAASTHNRRFSGTTRVLSPTYADIMAAFSSRGPASGLSADLLKPDLAAPGVTIFAAYASSGDTSADYELLSGTSMAAPHVAGAAALLAGLHPNWSPGQIQSALMTTGLAPLKKEDQITPPPTTPFDSGAGRVRLERAALAGLTLDQTLGDFTAANPALGGAPRDLNLPSLADAHCVAACSWTRSVRNTLGVPVTWTATTDTGSLTVTPAVFTIAAGETQPLTFRLDVSAQPFGSYVFGRATLSATGGLAPDVGFPVAALPQASDLPVVRTFTSAVSVATDTLTVETIGYSSLKPYMYGMTRGTAHSLSLTDGRSDSSTKLAVPAGAARLVAEIRASPAQDIDLYLIYDSNNNGGVDIGDSVSCQSASAAVEEYCALDSPAAGSYFVRVVNYAASQAGATDSINLVTAIVPSTDAQNLSVAAPATSAAGPISLQLKVNAPTSASGDYWYAQVRLTDDVSKQLLGVTNFDFHHLTDAATAITASSGGGQHTVVNTNFPATLAVTLTNGAGGRVANASVTFSAPSGGASATFPGGNTAITDQNGVARVTARANGTVGSYQVSASAAGASGALSASFTLDNTGPLVDVFLPLIRR